VGGFRLLVLAAALMCLSSSSNPVRKFASQSLPVRGVVKIRVTYGRVGFLQIGPSGACLQFLALSRWFV
jgi:hypothetical protein